MKKRPLEVTNLSEDTTTSIFRWCFRVGQFVQMALANLFQSLLNRLLGFMKYTGRYKEMENWTSIVATETNLSKAGYIYMDLLLRNLLDKLYLILHHKKWIDLTINRLVNDDVGPIAHAICRPLLTAYKLAAEILVEPQEWWDSWGPAIVSGLLSNSILIASNLLGGLLSIQHELYCFEKLKGEVSHNPRALLTILRVSQDVKIVTHSYKEIDRDTLHAMLIHLDSSIRLGALSLILGVAKGAKILTVEDEVYTLLLDTHVVALFFDEYENVDARLQFLSIFLKFLCSRHVETLKANSHGAGFEWMKKLVRWLKFFMMPSSSYSQLTMSISILHAMTSRMNFKHTIFEDDMLLTCLIQALFNDYENIREESKRILLNIPTERMNSFMTHVLKQELLDQLMKILPLLEGRKSEGVVNFFDFLGRLNRSTSWNHSITTSILDGMKNSPYIHGHFMVLSVVVSGSEEVAPLMSLVHNAWREYGPLICKDIVEDEEGITSNSVAYNHAWKLTKAANSLVYKLLSLMTDKELMAATEFLEQQIGSIKHRGVFTSIYPLYVRAMLQCLDRPNLKDYPKQRLQTLVTMNNQQGILRRLGGVPYLVSGILRAGNQRNWFELVFEQLFTVARKPLAHIADAKYDMPQVHAFNTMKQLFSDASIANDVLPFVAPALELLLQNFCHENWSLKNCAVMLFGVVRQRMMGGRIWDCNAFFGRYPQLKRILLDYLEEEVEHVLLRIFPVLLIWGDLEAKQNDEQLTDLKSHLLQLLGSKQWKVRQLAASTINRAFAPPVVSAILRSLWDMNLHNDFNFVNGTLLTMEQASNTHTTLIADYACSHFYQVFQMQPWANRFLLLKCIADREIELPDNELAYLGHLFCQFSNIDVSIGVQVLTLSAMARVLLLAYQRSEQRDMIIAVLQLALTMHFEVKLAALDFIRENPLYGELSDTVGNLVLTNEWRYTTEIAKDCLGRLLSHGAGPKSTFMVEICRDHLSSWALVVDLVDYTRFLDSCEKSEDVNALSIFIQRDLGRDTYHTIRGIILLAMIGLFHEDKDTRYSTAEVIARVLHIGQFKVCPTWLVFELPKILHQQFGGCDVTSIAMEYLMKVCKFEVPTKPHVLFGVERSNLFRNDLMLVRFLGCMLTDNAVAPPDMAVDVDAARRMVERLGYDGILGWLRLEYNFVPIFRLLVAAYYTDLDVLLLKQAMKVSECTLNALHII